MLDGHVFQFTRPAPAPPAQGYNPDQLAVQACAEFLLGQPRNPEVFGPVVPVADTASPLDRLIGLTGRDPGWVPAV